ncbi:MAG: hypothetical protein KME42_21105 [Tildeniella nuda ZEHNDER 1965/U140]|nr:hypothetical protein [Tildeniella nuda ZEHNDER 1965/U140]
MVVVTVCANRKSVLSNTLVSEVKMNESFSTEASDLFGTPQDGQAEIERQIEFMKNFWYFSNIEVGDRSCYINVKAGSVGASVEFSVYTFDVPTFVFTLSTPRREGQTVTLESEETALLEHRKYCYKLINVIRKYDILSPHLYRHQFKQPSNLEINREDYWNQLTNKD